MVQKGITGNNTRAGTPRRYYDPQTIMGIMGNTLRFVKYPKPIYIYSIHNHLKKLHPLVIQYKSQYNPHNTGKVIVKAVIRKDGKNIPTWFTPFLGVIQQYFDVKIIKDYTIPHNMVEPVIYYKIIGFEYNVLFAELYFRYLYNALDRMLDRYRKEHMAMARRRRRKINRGTTKARKHEHTKMKSSKFRNESIKYLLNIFNGLLENIKNDHGYAYENSISYQEKLETLLIKRIGTRWKEKLSRAYTIDG